MTLASERSSLLLDVRLRLDAFELRVKEQLQAGAIGVFGASGAGKTSLMESVMGLRRGVRGRIRLGQQWVLDSERGLDVPPERRQVGYVPQQPLLFPHLDVLKNVLYGARRAKRGQHGVPDVERVLGLLELEPLAARNVKTLSGGEQSRVALARALCSGAEWLLLDEPFASLDRALRLRLRELMLRIKAEIGIPMLFISHDAVDVQALCDSLLVLDQGKVVAVGAPFGVLTDAKVFGIARSLEFENVLYGTVLDHEADTTGVRVGDSQRFVRISIPRHPLAIGTKLALGVRAQDCVLSTQRPSGQLSARNILSARALDLTRIGDHALIKMELLPGIELAVELTELSRAEMKIAQGSELFILFKAQAVRYLGLG